MSASVRSGDPAYCISAWEKRAIPAGVGLRRPGLPPPAGDIRPQFVEAVGLSSEPDAVVVGVHRIRDQDAGKAGVRLELEPQPLAAAAEDREWERPRVRPAEHRPSERVNRVGVAGELAVDGNVRLRGPVAAQVRRGQALNRFATVDVVGQGDDGVRGPRPLDEGLDPRSDGRCAPAPDRVVVSPAADQRPGVRLGDTVLAELDGQMEPGQERLLWGVHAKTYKPGTVFGPAVRAG